MSVGHLVYLLLAHTCAETCETPVRRTEDSPTISSPFHILTFSVFCFLPLLLFQLISVQHHKMLMKIQLSEERGNDFFSFLFSDFFLLCINYYFLFSVIFAQRLRWLFPASVAHKKRFSLLCMRIIRVELCRWGRIWVGAHPHQALKCNDWKRFTSLHILFFVQSLPSLLRRSLLFRPSKKGQRKGIHSAAAAASTAAADEESKHEKNGRG